MQVIINRAEKYRIAKDNDPSVFSFLMQNFGCNRKVYNLCVNSLYAQLQKQNYSNGHIIPSFQCPKVSDLKKQYPYLKQADAQGLANSVLDFLAAWQKFLKQKDHETYTKRALRRAAAGTEPLSCKGLKGMPKFHSRAKGDNSYRTVCQYPSASNSLKNPTVRLNGNLLYIPKLKAGIRLVIHRAIPKDAHICHVTLRLDTDGYYYVSVAYSYTTEMNMDLRNIAICGGKLPDNLTFLGLDYSQKHFYVDSKGRKANCPHCYRKSEEKLAKLQKQLSRKQSGSSNYLKQKKKVQRLHAKIRNQRRDFAQQESTRLVRMYDVIVVEDIDLRAMGGALKLGKNLHDNGFGMFRTMLAYKLEQKGSCLVKVDKWYPSTKTCSHCGSVKEMKLGEDTYVCPVCGMTMDRDWNAAVNVERKGREIFLEYFRTLLEQTNTAA